MSPLKRVLPEIVLVLLSFFSISPHLASYFTSDDFLLLERARDFVLSDLFGPYLDIPVGVFFRPIAALIYAMVFQIAGHEPLIYHLFSFLLHTLNCILFYRLLMLLQERIQFKMLSLAAVAIVAIHPRVQETIATIYCFPDLLVATFSLLTMIPVFKYLSSMDKLPLICGLLTFMAALGSKESALIMLPVLPLVCFVFYTDKPSKQRLSTCVVLVLWFAGLTAAFLVLRAMSVGSFFPPYSEYADYSLAHLGIFLAKGIAAFVLPISFVSFLTKTGAVVFLGIVLAVAAALMRRKVRSVEFKVVLCFFAVAIVLLLPASMYSFSLATGQENRFLYFSIFPLSAAAVTVLSLLVPSKRALKSVSVVMIAGLMILTHLESRAWIAASHTAESTLESYSALLRERDEQNVVLLDGIMYLSGTAVGITPAALRLAPFLTGESKEVALNPRVLTLLSLETQDAEPAVDWVLEGDTLVGRSTTGKPIFLGPATSIGERSYFRSPTGLTIEALGFDPGTNSSRQVVIYPFSWFHENTVFMTTMGRTLGTIEFTAQSK